MKRFVWPLQKVLDIRTKEEQKKRAELLELTRKLTKNQSALLTRQMILKEMISDINKVEIEKRLNKQEFFLRYSATIDRQIKKMHDRVEQLKSEQRAKIEDVIETRRYKEGLEKLREEAKRKFIEHQERLEQKDADEMASISFVRERLRRNRIGSHGK